MSPPSRSASETRSASARLNSSTMGDPHDIGKVMVPVERTNKPSRLTDEEYREIKKHVMYGNDILRGYAHPGGRHISVRHHEKLSGRATRLT